MQLFRINEIVLAIEIKRLVCNGQMFFVCYSAILIVIFCSMNFVKIMMKTISLFFLQAAATAPVGLLRCTENVGLLLIYTIYSM